MLLVSLIAMRIVMLLALLRAFVGPTLFDRILAVNLLGTKTVLFIAILAFLSERAYFLDIAMIYALLNFISTIGVLRFFELKQRKPGNKENSW